ncbi:MAG: arsenite methyltransferase [Thermoanaerobaculia bacterium]
MSETTETKIRESLPADDEAVVEKVRERYAGIAETSSSCCSDSCGATATEPRDAAGRIGYSDADLDSVPEEANLGLGCGAPIDLLALSPGETVLDLGSGPGLDAFLAARLVGDTGRVIGVDMTPEMIERARAGARQVGLEQVEFRQGRLEDLPVEGRSVDAVISNCVINLVPDKARVFAETARVLRPGGRLVISDIVLDGPLPEAVGNDLLAYVGCIAGAMPREQYFDALRQAGLTEIEVLSDTDAVKLLGDEIPAEVLTLLERTGTTADDLRGKVRSVTYRAVKPVIA